MTWEPEASQSQSHSILDRNKQTISQMPAAVRAYGTAKSEHTADSALQPFLSTNFDAADYLNTVLTTQPPGHGTTNADKEAKSLSEISNDTQALLSRLNIHASRLAQTLTLLTDEILRSSNRLAYEVEVLRGQALSLSETLSEGLQDDILQFTTDGTKHQQQSGGVGSSEQLSSSTTTHSPSDRSTLSVDVAQRDPEYVTQLRTLTQVRARLDDVIQTFGDAMSWAMPPFEGSGDGTSAANKVRPEGKGQPASERFRSEVADMLMMSADPVAGLESAAKRVDELKDLAMVWRGTVEEKARTALIDSLAKMIEERHAGLMLASREMSSKSEPGQRLISSSESASQISRGGFGFMNQLQKIRGAI